MRAIDADALEKKLASFITDDRGGNLSYEEIANNEAIVDAMIEVHKMPTIDVVEVVRCKDCKYGSPPNKVYGRRLDLDWVSIREDKIVRLYGKDFCSMGEKRNVTIS